MMKNNVEMDTKYCKTANFGNFPHILAKNLITCIKIFAFITLLVHKHNCDKINT